MGGQCGKQGASLHGRSTGSNDRRWSGRNRHRGRKKDTTGGKKKIRDVGNANLIPLHTTTTCPSLSSSTSLVASRPLFLSSFHSPPFPLSHSPDISILTHSFHRSYPSLHLFHRISIRTLILLVHKVSSSFRERNHFLPILPTINPCFRFCRRAPLFFASRFRERRLSILTVTISILIQIHPLERRSKKTTMTFYRYVALKAVRCTYFVFASNVPGSPV